MTYPRSHDWEGAEADIKARSDWLCLPQLAASSLDTYHAMPLTQHPTDMYETLPSARSCAGCWPRSGGQVVTVLLLTAHGLGPSPSYPKQ